MIIRPGLETFIDSMVACDPLYLVDTRHGLLQPTLDRFEEPYRRRLRPYVIKEDPDLPLLSKIPDGQFGFVLAYNIFNFRPFEILERYLTEIYSKLRPGGTLAMTYNNCDLAHGVVLTELNYMCYTPASLVEQLARRIGYEITFRYDTHSPNTWLEITKPGNSQSIKGGQALATVKPKSST
jgi:SAM-dependent methyltransferase